MTQSLKGEEVCQAESIASERGSPLTIGLSDNLRRGHFGLGDGN